MRPPGVDHFAVSLTGEASHTSRLREHQTLVVVRRRYERRSIVITTNLAFGEWPTIFPNAARTTALIDRLVHHSEIISIEGESYRRREAEADKEATATRRRRRRS